MKKAKLFPPAHWSSISSLVQEELCHIYALEDKSSRSFLSWVLNPIPLFEDPFFAASAFFFLSIPQPTATLLPCLCSHFDCMHLSLESSG